MIVATVDQLEQVAAPAAPGPAKASQPSKKAKGVSLDELMAEHEPNADGPKPDGKGGRIWILSACAFDATHRGTSCAIGEAPDGIRYYRCFHDSCKDKRYRDWKLLRGIIDTDNPTDAENAAAFVKRFGDRIRYVVLWARWIVWMATHWVVDYGAVHVTELGKAITEDAGDNRSMVFLSRGIPGVPIDHEALDADPWLLGVINGVIDLQKGAFREARPQDLMTRQCPVSWSDTATCPRWERCMREWFPDEPTRLYVQRLVGAALIGEQRDHIMVIHYGDGSNGKGTFCRALQAVLGPYCVTPHMSLLVQQKHPEHDTQRAHLFRARVAIANETNERRNLDEASVKALTGGDRVQARRMREDPWEFTPSHSLWLACNHLPVIRGRDHGIWRRLKVVPWVSTFRRDQAAGEALDEVLRGEAAGILRWAVQGCLAYLKEGLAEPEAVVRASLEYREREDIFRRLKSDLGIVFGDEVQMRADDLLEQVEEWGRTVGVDLSANAVAGWLRSQGAQSKRSREVDDDGKPTGKRPTVWHGVHIPEPEDGEQTDVRPSGSAGSGGSRLTAIARTRTRTHTHTCAHDSCNREGADPADPARCADCDGPLSEGRLYRCEACTEAALIGDLNL